MDNYTSADGLEASSRSASTKMLRVIEADKTEAVEAVMPDCNAKAFPPFPRSHKIVGAPAQILSPFSAVNFRELDLSFAELPEISAKHLPPWMRAMAEEVADATQSPVGMATMLSLSVAATCLQGKLVVRGLKKSHTEKLSLWTCTVLPSGNVKTKVFEMMTAPLAEWEAEQNDKSKADRDRRKQDIEIAAKLSERLKNELAQLKSDSPDRPEKMKELLRQQEIVDSPLRPLKLLTNSGTMEGFRDLAIEQNGKVAILSEEGGIFEVAGGLYNNGQASIDLLMKGYQGTDHTEERAGKQHKIKNPCFTLGLCVQPVILETLQKNNDKTKGQMRGRGLLGRFFFCMPRSLVGQRDIENTNDISDETIETYRARVREMLMFVEDKTDDGTAKPFVLAMSTEAKEAYKAFWTSVEKRHGTATDGTSDDRDLSAIQDWTTKAQGAVLRIAGLLHFAEHLRNAKDRQISGETMTAAVNLCTALIPHAQAAFALMGDAEAPTDKEASKLYHRLRDNKVKTFTMSDLDSSMLKGASKSAAQKSRVLSVLERAGVITECTKVPTAGRPADVRYVNPLIFS